MSTLTDFLCDRLNQLQARKKTIQEIAGKKDIYKGKGFRVEDIPKIEADIKETELCLAVVTGKGLPEELSKFLVWAHTQKDWYWEVERNAFTRLRYAPKSPDQLYQWYVSNIVNKKVKSSTNATK